MFTSLSSSNQTEVHPRPDSQARNFKPVRRRQAGRKFGSIKLVILAVLASLAQGHTHSATFSPDSSGPQMVEIDRVAQTANETTPDLSPPVIQATSAQIISDSATSVELLRIGNLAIPTPFSLPGRAETLEPTVSSPAILDIATSWPRSSPTATALPTSTPLPLPAVIPPPAEKSQTDIEHVVIISIDGLRPDALDLADTPTWDDLRNKGTYFPQTQTVKQSWTLPSHASMLSGMLPEKHGLLWSLPYIGWPGLNGPTLFNVVHHAGYSTAMVFGKEKLNYLVLDDSVDRLFGQDAHDTEVKEKAIEFIDTGLPNVLFIHFPDTDRVGHAYGWMSTNQFYAITFVDGLIGEVVAALDTGGYLNRTLLIVTADHGGRDHSHGDDAPLDRTIPWLAVGPNVPAGVTHNRPINTYDTASTVLHVFALPIPDNWDGQPVMEIFQ